jgi:release factor glutamine methyltransferase
MTRQRALNRARELLTASNIEDATLEAELLLRFTLNIDRTKFFTEPDFPLSPQQEKTYQQYIERRINREPSAYITGHREFFGLDFEVNKNVLIPRPETELLVEQVLARAKKYNSPVIVDVGTGCGNIAVCLAVNLPDARIYATDISEPALKMADRNFKKHHVENRIKAFYGNLLEPLDLCADIIAANLPYVRTVDLPNVNTTGYEPRLALDGGVDGLNKIRELIIQGKDKLIPGGCLLLEIGLGQHREVTDFLHNILPSAKIEVTLDLGGIDRIIGVTNI